jgi:hypothetical protein
MRARIPINVLLLVLETKLKDADESDNLSNTGGRNGIEGSEASLHGCIGKTESDVTRAADASSGDNVTKNGKHGNAAVLSLIFAEKVEAFLISALEDTERIPEAERNLSTNLLWIEIRSM